ncbi:hypothetical protein EK21DRAFT_118062 [Setomelanomma holmii]|uniref:Uncharacterized protein n=1 Tax=Setomelanomma holmii TaxID=210430 RepID=A0A9P4GYQ5_9PLEO|nr:hypothetical protein EK21DRAFT_118062 [Setomelanomma holmii]
MNSDSDDDTEAYQAQRKTKAKPIADSDSDMDNIEEIPHHDLINKRAQAPENTAPEIFKKSKTKTKRSKTKPAAESDTDMDKTEELPRTELFQQADDITDGEWTQDYNTEDDEKPRDARDKYITTLEQDLARLRADDDQAMSAHLFLLTTTMGHGPEAAATVERYGLNQLAKAELQYIEDKKVEVSNEVTKFEEQKHTLQVDVEKIEEHKRTLEFNIQNMHVKLAQLHTIINNPIYHIHQGHSSGDQSSSTSTSPPTPSNDSAPPGSAPRAESKRLLELPPTFGQRPVAGHSGPSPSSSALPTPGSALAGGFGFAPDKVPSYPMSRPMVVGQPCPDKVGHAGQRHVHGHPVGPKKPKAPKFRNDCAWENIE